MRELGHPSRRDGSEVEGIVAVAELDVDAVALLGDPPGTRAEEEMRIGRAQAVPGTKVLTGLSSGRPVARRARRLRRTTPSTGCRGATPATDRGSRGTHDASAGSLGSVSRLLPDLTETVHEKPPEARRREPSPSGISSTCRTARVHRPDRSTTSPGRAHRVELANAWSEGAAGGFTRGSALVASQAGAGSGRADPRWPRVGAARAGLSMAMTSAARCLAPGFARRAAAGPAPARW